MQYWLMKSEPDVFSIQDLANAPHQQTFWEGVRNYQARNFMRQMQLGDLAFFYHSNANPLGIVGIMKVVETAQPDETQFDPNSDYFDPKSTPDNPRWSWVTMEFVEAFPVLPLSDLKAHTALADFQLIQKGSRLSVMPVTPEQWNFILAMTKA